MLIEKFSDSLMVVTCFSSILIILCFQFLQEDIHVRSMGDQSRYLFPGRYLGGMVAMINYGGSKLLLEIILKK